MSLARARGRRRGSGRRALGLDQRQHRADRHLRAGLHDDLAQHAVLEDLDVDGTLVGLDHRHDVAALHAAAGCDVPLDDGALVHVRAERGQPEFTSHR
jgi:hypothetical protein